MKQVYIEGSIYPGRVVGIVFLDSEMIDPANLVSDLKLHVYVDQKIEIVIRRVDNKLSETHAFQIMVVDPYEDDLNVEAVRHSIAGFLSSRCEQFYDIGINYEGTASGFPIMQFRLLDTAYSNCPTDARTADCIRFMYDIYDSDGKIIAKAGQIMVPSGEQWDKVEKKLNENYPNDRWKDNTLWGVWKFGV